MRKRRIAIASAVALVAVLAVGASAMPAMAQGTVTVDTPDEVEPEGDFEFTVEMRNSSVGEVAVESTDFDTTVSVIDDAGDSTGAQTDTSVEFIDIDAGDSTYTLNVDVTGGSEGDTGTITAATGAGIGSPGVDDTATSTFVIEGPTGDNTGNEGSEGDSGGEGGRQDTTGATGDQNGGGGKDTDGSQDGTEDGQDTDAGDQNGGTGGAQDQDTDENGGTGDMDAQDTQDGSDGQEPEQGDETDGNGGQEEGLPGFTPVTGLVVTAVIAFVLLAIRYRE